MPASSGTGTVAAPAGAAPAPRRRFAAWVEARVLAWMHRRQARTDTLVLTQRNVYILPTAAGWTFAATLGVLLLASINYQLNLGFLLTFLLAGSGLSSMHLTHGTLRGLTLHLRPTGPCHAGDPAALDLVATSPAGARHGVGLRRADAGDAAWIDVPALGQAPARLGFVPTVRGLQALPALVVETRFPLGLFRAWSPWRPAGRVLVYPRLEHPTAPLPGAAPAPGGPGPARRTPRGEVDGVRAYRRGDAARQVAWKKAARSVATEGELVSRDHAEPAERELRLDWAACAPLPPEARLSRLAAWVLAAERAGLAYGLALPGLELPTDRGDAHRRRCLEALALWRG